MCNILLFASRRSFGSVSVPMWPFTLSGRLLIVALVSIYLTNQLIRRESILYHRVFHTACHEAVRLCGISSRFQLLSPSTRQVTHALLTRPPLTYISLGFNVSPFDLHVLGTPPAFILSQDQTLMLKWCLCPASFIWHCLLLIRVASRSFDRSACS